MKNKTLRDAVERIDDDLIAEAGRARRARHFRWPAIASAAACLAVFVCAAAFLPGLLAKQPNEIDLHGGGSGVPTTFPRPAQTTPPHPSDAGGNYQQLAAVSAVFPQSDRYSDRSIVDMNPVSGSFQQALNRFALRTASEVIDAEQNALYSPLSLYYALSLSAAGAQGNTQAEMLALLGVSDAETLAEQCGNLYRLLYRDNSLSQLRIANSMWLQESAPFRGEYLQTAADDYYASLFSVDFSDAETGRAMAAWIADNTNGTLSYEYAPVSRQMMSLLNAVSFRAEWQDRFDSERTAQDLFTLASGETVACDFMNRRSVSHGFAKGDGFTRSSLALKNAGSMVFVLPDEGISVGELLSSPEKIEECFFGGESGNGEVIWQIPKFSYHVSMSLSDTLQALGMTSAFDSALADFSGVSSEPLWIADVSQDAHIAIDENGVVASAFTEILYAGAAMPEGSADMRLTRPFLYGIIVDGQLLFVGVCANPAA